MVYSVVLSGDTVAPSGNTASKRYFEVPVGTSIVQLVLDPVYSQNLVEVCSSPR